MRPCDRCQRNPADVVVFGEMCVCQPCARALEEQAAAPYATGALDDVSPLGILIPPLGLAEHLGLVSSTHGMSLGHTGDWLGQQASPQHGGVTVTPPALPPLPLESDRDGFPFLKVMVVLGTLGAVALVGSALVRTTKAARSAQSGAIDAIKKHPEVLMAL